MTSLALASTLHVYVNRDNPESGQRAFVSPFLKINEPYIVEEPSMRILKEPSDFLRQHYVESGKRSSPNTWRAAAFGLKSWLEFLAADEIDWAVANSEDLRRFRDAHLVSISPQTGNQYADATIAARMRTVIAFYDFAGSKGWYSGTLQAGQHSPNVLRSIDSDALAHIRKEQQAHRRFELLDLLPTTRKSPPNPLTIADWRRLCASLGPLPSEKEGSGLRSCRNRLLAEIAVWTGLRINEVRGLSKYQFLAMVPDPDAPGSYQRLTVSKDSAKGRKARAIRIPNWLVEEINLYIEGERAECVALGKARGRAESRQLFVSGYGPRWVGKPIGTRRIEQILEQAMYDAGLVTMASRVDAETGKMIDRVAAKYSFHDLRHTYAVWTYWGERHRGNAEPWKHIQAQLGHKSLRTTIDTYLHYVEIFDGCENPVDVRNVLGL